MTKIYIFLMFVLFAFTPSRARKCQDFMLYQGSEQLVTYGMDTTRHWWAVTKPFADSYRLIVDGNETVQYKRINELTFSPDGNRWACFVRNNVQWFLLTNDTLIPISGDTVGEIEFSPNSRQIAYSFFESNDEIIIHRGERIRTYQRTGKIFLSFRGDKIAWVAGRGDGYVLNINGNESEVFNGIIPIGFWCDNQLFYAASNGDSWEIYKGTESISDIYSSIIETAININGNVAAVIAKEQSGKQVGMLFSDEYYEPLVGNKYDKISNLILHPSLPMLAYNAILYGKELVVLNTSEYSGGSESTGRPEFTHDGEDLFFLGCDLHCFVNINGQKFTLNNELPLDRYYAKKPQSNTIAYATNASMIIRDIGSNEMYAGMMVDEIISPRYNWRTGDYETLGSIGNRLYLMTCHF